MNTHDCLAQIFQRFNQSQWAFSDHACLTEKNVLFVQEASVEYPVDSCRCQYGVRQQDLVTAGQFSRAFGELMTGGPDWIHANLVPFGEDRFLITLCTGRKVGNSQSSINISYEPDKTAEILLTKTLVTAN